MTKTSDFERLAEIKSIIKQLDEEAKLLQATLLEDPHCPQKIETEYGNLVATSRTTYECTDKGQAFKEMGENEFIAAASITLPAVKKVCGTAKADAFLDKEVFKVKSVSRYFTLRK